MNSYFSTLDLQTVMYWWRKPRCKSLNHRWGFKISRVTRYKLSVNKQCFVRLRRRKPFVKLAVVCCGVLRRRCGPKSLCSCRPGVIYFLVSEGNVMREREQVDAYIQASDSKVSSATASSSSPLFIFLFSTLLSAVYFLPLPPSVHSVVFSFYLWRTKLDQNVSR